MTMYILIVEDTEVLAETIADSLRMEGFEVAITANGKQALDNIEERIPDIVITDLLMPQMDGLDFTRRFRQDPRHKQTPVIIISAQVTDDVFHAGQEAGANLFLKKPFDQNQLIDSVSTLLKND